MISKPSHKMKITLVTLMDDLHWDMNEGNATTFVLPDHSSFQHGQPQYYSGLPASFGNKGHCAMVVLLLPKQGILTGDYEEVQSLGTPVWDALNLISLDREKQTDTTKVRLRNLIA